jgi:hypothetical protein
VYGWGSGDSPQRRDLHRGQRFVLRELAEAFAEAERQILEKGGA